MTTILIGNVALKVFGIASSAWRGRINEPCDGVRKLLFNLCVIDEAVGVRCRCLDCSTLLPVHLVTSEDGLINQQLPWRTLVDENTRLL